MKDEILNQLRASKERLDALKATLNDIESRDNVANNFDFDAAPSPAARAAFKAVQAAQKAHVALINQATALHDKELARTILNENLSDL